MQSPSQAEGQGRFSIPSIATLYNSTFAQGFSNNERQASARALLRHDAHVDGAHYQTRRPGGLHPSYIGFTDSGTTKKMADQKSLTEDGFLEAVLQDVFDAVSYLYFRVV